MQGTETRRSTARLWPDPSWRLAPLDSPSVLLSLGSLQAEALEATLRYHIESLKFLKSRLEEDLRFLKDIQSPDHSNDAFDLWSVFWQDALLDYSREGARMAEIGSSIATKMAKRLHRDEKLLAENMAAQSVGTGL
ncbi:hypothetical protein QD460_30155 [Rhizobium jaguaris]|uniref:hypothetical protein n=1 Tax=Rhizobium jaguaris TaxID=1312183 RepID=UPI0039BEEC2D